MFKRPILVTAALACFQMAAVSLPGLADDVVVNNSPPVSLVLLDKLMSGRSKVGDQVRYQTAATVYAGNHQALIPAGSPAFGTVTRSKGSGMFGKRGQLSFTCEYIVLPDGSHVPLHGANVQKAGANDIAATAAVTVLVSPLGLLIKGGTVEVDAGTPTTMYIADGAKVTPLQSAPPNLNAALTLTGKNAADVRGSITGFDGTTYTVDTGAGQQQVAADQVKSISLGSPAPQPSKSPPPQ